MSTTIESLCDGDYVAAHVDLGLRVALNNLTLEWAQQEYNRSIWEPRPWPGESNE